MTSEPTPQPQTVSRMLLGGLVSMSLFFGAMGGLAVLFIGDDVFDKTPDPAVEMVRVNEDLARAQQRLEALEKKVETTQSTDNVNVEAELAALREKIAAIKSVEAQDDTSRILLGLTQLNVALENDLPLMGGIDTLKSAVAQPETQALLTELSELSKTGIPSYSDIAHDLAALKPAQAAPQVENLTLQERGRLLMSKFVRVRPTGEIDQQSKLSSIEQSLRARDLPIVRDQLITYQSSPGIESLINKINARIRAETIVRNLVVAVTRGLSNPGGTLY